MLAGNITISKNAKPAEARLEVVGINNPIAPMISTIPVMVTMRPGLGKAGGTILIRSGRRFPQCADAVNKNIRATAVRNEVSQSSK